MKTLVAALTLVSASAWAQTPDVSPDFSIEGIHHIWYVVPTGVDIALTSGPWKLALGAGVD